jgi:hypothetical protein
MGENMTRTGWLLTELASQLLDRSEREAVRGDLAECGAGGWHALRQVLGLVARRQAACWADWRPWMAVFAIVVPIGLMLSHAARWWADSYAIDILIYTQLWDVSYLKYPGWPRELALVVWSGTLSAAALAGWSWTAGYVLASLSRRTVWTAVALFALILFLGTLGTATIARANASAFAGHFFGVVFPRLVRFLLVMLPALWGVHCFRRASMSRVMLATTAVALIALTLLAAPFLERSMTLGRGEYLRGEVLGPDNNVGTADDLRPLWPISLVMVWPTAAILYSTWRRGSVSSLRS